MQQAKVSGLETTVQRLVHFVDVHVPRIRWTNDQIDTLFGKRSPRQILEEGHTFYMNPCLDLTLVTYEQMRQQGMDPTLVVLEVSKEAYPIPTLHFALEFTRDGKHFLDFSHCSHVFFGDGEYRFVRGLDYLQMVKIPDFEPKGNVLEDIGPALTPVEFTQEKVLERLKRVNTPLTYRNYLSSLPNGDRFQLEYVA